MAAVECWGVRWRVVVQELAGLAGKLQCRRAAVQATASVAECVNAGTLL
jgi:hypothetical protein